MIFAALERTIKFNNINNIFYSLPVKTVLPIFFSSGLLMAKSQCKKKMLKNPKAYTPKLLINVLFSIVSVMEVVEIKNY